MGQVSFLLHGHLPFVYHPEKESFLEEDWFNETMAEVYIPLVIMLNEIKIKNLKNCFTISLSPTLLAMMDNKILTERFVTYLNKRISYLQADVDKFVENQECSAYLKAAFKLLEKYKDIRYTFTHKYKKNLIAQFKKLFDSNVIEIITTNITHTFSPNFQPFNFYLQFLVKSAVDNFEYFFGKKPKGLWLPECGYFEGLEKILQNNGIEYTILEAHGILMADSLPVHGIYSPVVSASGFTFFPRDIDSAKNVWSRETGYPSTKEYRDFHSDIGTSWNSKNVKNLLHKNIDEDYIKSFTGIKYWSIEENKRGDKKPYNPYIAHDIVVEHAKDFLDKREAVSAKVEKHIEINPLFTAPYDMELFGHWWYEGMDFLKEVAIESTKRDNITLTTFSHYLATERKTQVITPKYSTWGQNGFSQVWNNEGNNKLLIFSHEAVEKFEELLQHMHQFEINDTFKRAAVLLSKIVTLLTCSDWPFLINSGIYAYPTKRFYIHKEEFDLIFSMIINNSIDNNKLDEFENRYPLFKNINFSDLENYYA